MSSANKKHWMFPAHIVPMHSECIWASEFIQTAPRGKHVSPPTMLRVSYTYLQILFTVSKNSNAAVTGGAYSTVTWNNDEYVGEKATSQQVDLKLCGRLFTGTSTYHCSLLLRCSCSQFYFVNQYQQKDRRVRGFSSIFYVKKIT